VRASCVIRDNKPGTIHNRHRGKYVSFSGKIQGPSMAHPGYYPVYEASFLRRPKENHASIQTTDKEIGEMAKTVARPSLCLRIDRSRAQTKQRQRLIDIKRSEKGRRSVDGIAIERDRAVRFPCSRSWGPEEMRFQKLCYGKVVENLVFQPNIRSQGYPYV
jgi:hypothetical protein